VKIPWRCRRWVKGWNKALGSNSYIRMLLVDIKRLEKRTGFIVTMQFAQSAIKAKLDCAYLNATYTTTKTYESRRELSLTSSFHFWGQFVHSLLMRHLDNLNDRKNSLHTQLHNSSRSYCFAKSCMRTNEKGWQSTEIHIFIISESKPTKKNTFSVCSPMSKTELA